MALARAAHRLGMLTFSNRLLLGPAGCSKADLLPANVLTPAACQQVHRAFANKQGSNAEAEAAAEAKASASDDEQSAGNQSDTEASSSSPDLAELQAQLAQAREEASNFKDRWQRSHAEMQNLIARQAREKETMQTYAVQKFAESLLEVADNLESAAKAVPPEVLQDEGAALSPEKALPLLRSLLEGVLATERVLLKTMASKGVQRIETAEGDAFDPNTQEAMSTLPRTNTQQEPGTIAVKWQSGYKIHDRILRAAKVIVYQD